MQTVRPSIHNPYANTPEDDLIAFRAKLKADDLRAIQAIFPGKSGVLQAVFNTLVKQTADYVRKHRYTYLERTTVEAYLCARLTDPESNPHSSGQDDGGGTTRPRPEAQGDSADKPTGQVSEPEKVVRNKRAKKG